jgi:hypothetical protein
MLAMPAEAWAAYHDLTSGPGADLRLAADQLAVALVAAEYGIWPPYDRAEADRRTGRRARRRYLAWQQVMGAMTPLQLRRFAAEHAGRAAA